jgi:hypothetical protein
MLSWTMCFVVGRRGLCAGRLALTAVISRENNHSERALPYVVATP